MKLKLHELKQQLETDATQRAEAQETTIKKQFEEIRQLKYEKDILQNRCFAMNFGALCPFCDPVMKGGCTARRRLGGQ